jgi:tetratricopeptide (TPR) repeat protein
VLDLLTSLIDKSLVTFEQSEARSRYRLLETVRQYARERLVESGGAEAIRARHRDYFVALAEEADDKLLGAEQADSLRRLEDEHDNLRLALEWSHAEAPAREDLRLCAAMHRFWLTRGYAAEGRQWCARMLAKGVSTEPTLEYARVVNAAGSLAWYQTDFRAARPLLEQGLALSRGLDDRLGLARSLNNLGSLAFEQGDYPAAQTLYEESLAVWRELGDQRGAAGLLGNLALVAWERGDLVAARTLAQESLALSREVEDQGRVADALSILGNVACDQGDLATAWAQNQESLAIGRELGDRDCIATALYSMGVVAFLRGELGDARSLYGEAIGIRREIGDRLGLVRVLEGIAALAAARGDSLAAARTWGAAERLREELGSPVSPNERPRNDRYVAMARAATSDEGAFDRAWLQGHKMPLNEAIELAFGTTIVQR